MIIVECGELRFKKVTDSWQSARTLLKEIMEWLYRNGFRYFNEVPVYDANGRIESRILSAVSENKLIEVIASPL